MELRGIDQDPSLRLYGLVGFYVSVNSIRSNIQSKQEIRRLEDFTAALPEFKKIFSVMAEPTTVSVFNRHQKIIGVIQTTAIEQDQVPYVQSGLRIVLF
jgi:hypothetical protein